jgi:rhodanese-related sulfurtransferase
MFFERLPDFIAAHPILTALFVGLTIAIIYTEIARRRRGYEEVNPYGLVNLINREDATVIDISPLADFEKGHIAGARHVMLSQLDPKSKDLAKLADKPVAIVCRTGSTAGQAARRLVMAGFKRVAVLGGGMHAWIQAELPLARGKPRKDKG